MKIIVSFSGGKDSTWMLLEMIRRGEHIDEVVFFDTGWEFPQMIAHVAKIKRLVEEHGITFTTLHPDKPFDYWMFEHPKKNGEVGWSWCGRSNCRWGTDLKIQAIDKHFKSEPEHVQCVGIAADELYRLDRKNNQQSFMRHPLIEWNITEAECLAGCYAAGYDWGGLYEQLDRVSCRFCGLKNLKELRNIYWNMPGVWQELRDYQNRTYMPYRKEGWSIFDLEKRFELEKEFEAAGKSVRSREFHQCFRSLLKGSDEP